ncbi:peptidoglycan DD-metalloendopeptidase family protein [Mucilaginibacter sp. BJC16-A38]|uniref:peptidoglycan DD-metalloendopeptidase family protein n=1 Tax=Mucilaginibacter phenanthrenivorans TaxID=1234842 RepID=UPI0021571241|nr:peptidoglycan DD-metalloendopeptidase family protein [Mucilaginibacter phenanthrenivorans]MCR8557579.1 peptidoglycan DD-metalloendopeptidase family protein [Mucilaginibacter phenanthrenivorans]
MDAAARLAAYFTANPGNVGKVVDYNADADCLYHFDLTASNTELDADTFSDTARFSNWINKKLSDNNCRYGIGGYMEHRTIYARSAHFDTEDEPRRLHLGVDIWAKAGTPVYSPLDATVHSFHDNDNFGDYGPTIILQHQLDDLTLYSLYGHLSRASLDGLYVGKSISKNEKMGSFGDMEVNGHWPPHLHFQLMFDMQGKQGDFPGVCRFSEKEIYQKNTPDPQLILKFADAMNG